MEITELTKLLEPPNAYFDGYLVFHDKDITWSFTISQGRPLHAVNELHAARRWNRTLEKYFPNSSWHTGSAQPEAHKPWQIQWLDAGVSQHQLSLIRVKLMIREIIQECLFELSLCKQLKYDWRPDTLPLSRTSRSIALSTWEMQMTLNKVQDLQQRWQAMGIEWLEPSLAPILKQPVDSQRLLVSRQYLNGEFSLWAIAAKYGKSIAEIVQNLLPLYQDKSLEFQSIPDLPLSAVKLPGAKSSTIAAPKPIPSVVVPQSSAPPASAPPAPTPVKATPPKPQTTTLSNDNSHQPLIACIDDSPVLAHSLKKILATGGYRTLIIQEPMQGFSQLIEHMPKLILLDVMLPHADGYNVCRFLRDTPVFEKTPIIILTGRSKPVDRARASMAGATEFLVKPPEPKELLAMIHKHLETAETVSG